MATLSFKSVRKFYEGTPVIHKFNLDVKDSEFIVVVGPSGCGKTTLLRMIAGLEAISEGNITIGDRVINDLSPKDRDIAMVFQNYALYPHMTVYDNMAYGLRMHGHNKATIQKRVSQAAKILELGHVLKRKPRALSGGQRQRVAMGRAIVRQPALFLFDEPLSNLDAKLRVQMRLEIKKLQRELKTTSVYVTHDQTEAMTMADRLVVFNKGYAEQIGTPLELYEKPATVFVGGFIGSPAMNFLDATVSSDGCSVEVVSGVSLSLGKHAYPVQPGQAVTLGIRPESMLEGKHSAADAFTLEVVTVETLGADTLLHGCFPGDKQVITARLAGKSRPEVGKQVKLSVLSTSLHLFDAKTGIRIE